MTTVDPSTWGLSDAGFRRPPLAELIEAYALVHEKRLRENNVEEWRVVRDASSVHYAMICANADMADIYFGCLEAVWLQMHPATATGLALQALGRIVGVTKYGQAVSLARLTLTGHVTQHDDGPEASRSWSTWSRDSAPRVSAVRAAS